MDIELGQLPDGDLALVCGTALRANVKRVEYYRDQRLLMLVYDIPDDEGDLMHYELRDEIAAKVQRRGSLVVIEPDKSTGKPMGYYASLIQVGELQNFAQLGAA